MKKSIVLLLAMIIVLSLCACSGGNGSVSTDSLAVGDQIEFGSYEQDNNEDNGKEPIKWIVLGSLDSNYIILLSRYGLDVQPYHSKHEAVTWETSTLRSWLNSDFYDIAFNEEEKQLITEIKLQNPDNSYDGSKGGNDTLDKVWLLNEYDARNYIQITGLNDAWVENTQYVQAKGVDQYYCYWLRSPNKGMQGTYSATFSWHDETLGKDGTKVTNEHVVRPVIVIPLDKKVKVASCNSNILSDSSADALEYEDPDYAPEIGMTEAEVLGSYWGEPDDINTTTTTSGTEEQWVYDGRGYLYFEDGILTTIQER